MLDEKIQVNYDQSEFKESNFGIRNKSDMVHLFNVMRNKIYANKPLAVLREYSTNANDAHIESGQKGRPIEVRLPTMQSPELEIRDYGTGLSEEDVRNIYTMYGASTKRGSTELNGQMGLGSKSAFAYGDRFKIISIQEGVKKEYEAYVDETKLGAIALTKTSDTTEASGITIRVPVKPNDINTFCNVAVEFYPFFSPTPTFVGRYIPTITVPKKIVGTDNWALVENGSWNPHPKAVMGNVSYPLDGTVMQQALSKTKNWPAYQNLLQTPLLINFKVGDLNIAASREALEYDSQTLSAIVRAFDQLISEAKDVIEKKLADCKDLVHAKYLYADLNAGHQAKLISAVSNASFKFQYKGKNINASLFSLPDIDVTIQVEIPSEEEGGEATTEDRTVPAYSFQQYRKNYTRCWNHTAGYNFIPRTVRAQGTNSVIYVRDSGCKKPVLRVKNIFELDPTVQNVYVVEMRGDATVDEFCEEMDLPREYISNLSLVEPLKVEKTEKVVNKKHSKKYFTLSTAANLANVWVNSSHWEALPTEDIKTEDKIYVLIDQYKAKYGKNSFYNRPNELKEVLDKFRIASGVNIANRIVGVKDSAKDNIPAGWTSLDAYMKARLPELEHLLEARVISSATQSLIGNSASKNFGLLLTVSCFTEAELQEINDVELTAYKKIVSNTSTNSTMAARTDALLNIASMFSVSFASIDSKVNAQVKAWLPLAETVIKRYPLLSKISIGTTGPSYYETNKINMNTTSDRRFIIDYIKLVNNQKLS